MKKIIAAALSVLIGSLGLTVVDKTLESRVATLESEVVVLREEVSNYHNNGLSTETLTVSSTQRNEPSTGIYPEQGDFLGEKPDSQNKFLFRKYNDGSIRYISVNEMNRPTSSDNSLQYNEYFLCVTHSSAQVSNVEEKTTYYIRYDEDYSSYTSVSSEKSIVVSVVLEGYTDPVFAGKKLRFEHYSHSHIESVNYTDTIIRSDGSFSYHAEYIVNTKEGIYGFNSFDNPTIYG